MEDLAKPAVAGRALGQRGIRERLLDVESVIALGAAVRVGGHNSPSGSSKLERRDPIRGDDAVHSLVVEFARNFVNELTIEDHSINRRALLH